MPHTIGLDIGSSAVRAVELSVTGRGPSRLLRTGQVELPPGAMRDGEVVDGDVVTEALRTLWERYKFSHRKVTLGLANQQVVVRQVDLPHLPLPELRQSLEFQAQDHIPFPVEQAILDLHVLDEYESDSGVPMSRILLVAAQRTMVDSLVACVRAAKLTPVKIDLDAFAMVRSLVRHEPRVAGEGEMLLDIGADVTKIVVHDCGVPKFVRVLLMGGSAVTASLSKGLGISHEEAERTKATAGMAGDGAPPAGEAERLIADRTDELVREIRGSLDYYAAQPEAVGVHGVVLSGGGARLPDLQTRLSSELDIPVERGHPMQEIKIGKVEYDYAQLVDAEPQLAVAVGLAVDAR
ncbi:MAG: type IV pilus assembly protein PilM [Egibacteraceae bacterium]